MADRDEERVRKCKQDRRRCRNRLAYAGVAHQEHVEGDEADQRDADRNDFNAEKRIDAGQSQGDVEDRVEQVTVGIAERILDRVVHRRRRECDAAAKELKQVLAHEDVENRVAIVADDRVEAGKNE